MTSPPTPRRDPVAGLRRRLWHPLDRVTTHAENLLLLLCALATLAAMFLTTADVVMRYGFKSPITWGFDFIMLYLMPAAYYMGFSYGMKTGAHLSVDFFAPLLPRFVNRSLVPLVLLIGAGLTGYITWLLFAEAWEAFHGGDRLFGSVAWLTWPVSAIIGVSFALFTLRVVLQAFVLAFPEPEAWTF